jgi:hypothetical protein
MATDVPMQYLQKAVNVMVGTRGLGSAARTREGYLPYSTELDFRGVDEATGNSKVAWASDQAPYAEIRVVPGSAATGTLTVFIHVAQSRLALYIVEHALLLALGQTWATATGRLPALIKRLILQTVDSGASWATLLTRLHAAQGTLYSTISLIEGDISVAAGGEVVSEAVQQVVPEDVQALLIDRLRAQIVALDLVIKALESGDYLAGA